LAWVLGGALLAVACSGGDPAENNATMNVAADADAPANAVTGNVAVPRGGMTAQVSALNADISGLNTRITDMGLVIDLPSDALFEYDKAELTPAAETELRKAAELIRRSPPGSIMVIGHTDSDGDDAYNQTLSEARAKTVADWFGQQVGVRQRQFAVSGKGETAPIAPNGTADGKDDPAGRARNRRVEVIVPKPGG
jgi:outer membrane protein OmpA-like peptidoglycan-associated protein